MSKVKAKLKQSLMVAKEGATSLWAKEPETLACKAHLSKPYTREFAVREATNRKDTEENLSKTHKECRWDQQSLRQDLLGKASTTVLQSPSIEQVPRISFSHIKSQTCYQHLVQTRKNRGVHYKGMYKYSKYSHFQTKGKKTNLCTSNRE